MEPGSSMAKKDKTEESAEGVLTTAAKKLGSAAGKVTAAVGATPETSSTVAPPVKQPSTKVPKLEKKNKNRLPRREKKARQKAANV
jgi:hypothetical protein